MPLLHQCGMVIRSFWGGISTQKALPVYTPDKLRALIRQTAAVMRTVNVSGRAIGVEEVQ